MILFSARARARFLLRAWGGAIVSLALVEATAAAWVAWYLADAVWSGAPLSASRTPVHPVVFAGTSTAAIALATLVGVIAGRAATRRAWVGPDPTAVLPVSRVRRWFERWAMAAAVVAVATSGVVPVYVAIAELGGVTPHHAVRALVGHAAAIALAPLAGLAMTRFGR